MLDLRNKKPSKKIEPVIYVRVIDNRTFRSLWYDMPNTSVSVVLNKYCKLIEPSQVFWDWDTITVYIN